MFLRFPVMIGVYVDDMDNVPSERQWTWFYYVYKTFINQQSRY